jgi:hypothetical protein
VFDIETVIGGNHYYSNLVSITFGIYASSSPGHKPETVMADVRARDRDFVAHQHPIPMSRPSKVEE